MKDSEITSSKITDDHLRRVGISPIDKVYCNQILDCLSGIEKIHEDISVTIALVRYFLIYDLPNDTSLTPTIQLRANGVVRIRWEYNDMFLSMDFGFTWHNLHKHVVAKCFDSTGTYVELNPGFGLTALVQKFVNRASNPAIVNESTT